MRNAIAVAVFVLSACRGATPDDVDGDGFGAATDCRDDDAAIHPGAPEACNGVDDDCSGVVDDNPVDAPVWYVDLDADGVVGSKAAVASCLAPAGAGPEPLDCDDVDRAVHPGAIEVCNDRDDDCDDLIDDADPDVDLTTARAFFVDADQDRYGSAVVEALSACATPTGFVDNDGDCDDDAPGVNPSAPEVCNGGLDDDCNGAADDDDQRLLPSSRTTFYVDRDGDTYGGAFFTVQACEKPEGATLTAEDCDDLDARISPDATEVCDGRDNDCDRALDDADDSLTGAPTWTLDDDGDGHGAIGGATVRACAMPERYAAVADDCDDDASDVFPGAREVCNDRDDDCDGLRDGDDLGLDLTSGTRFWTDRDGDGHGGTWFSLIACKAPLGMSADALDCDDDDADRSPSATEVCNGYDDDCDGTIDDQDDSLDTSTGQTWHADLDGDGWGAGTDTVEACEPPDHYGTDTRDCNDNDELVHPDADEVCNGIDDDCDTRTDDLDDDLSDDGATWFADDDHDGWGTRARVACQDFGFGWTNALGDCHDGLADVHPDALETCNHRDDDCDGFEDEDATDARDWYVDDDGDGFGTDVTVRACFQAPKTSNKSGDCDDALPGVKPTATEVCDTIDNNCNGVVDTDTPNLPSWYVDVDGDTWGVDGTGVKACATFAGRASRGGDCDDDDGLANPGQVEVDDDGVDNDCDGSVDFPDPLEGGLITTDTTWGSGAGDVFSLGFNALVTSGVTLTIAPCTRILMAPGSTLQIEGKLIARGAPDCPIVFTSAKATPARGDWARLFFTSSHVPGVVDGDGAYVSGSVLEHVEVLYSGSVGGGVVVNGTGSPAILDVRIAYSSSAGLSTTSPSLFVRDSRFTDNTGAGLSTSGPYNRSTILDSRFERNGSGASLSGGCCGAEGTVRRSVFANNTGTGMTINGDYNPWEFTDNRFVNNGSYGLNSFNGPGLYQGNWFVKNRYGTMMGYSGLHTVTGNVFADNTEAASTTQHGGSFEWTGNVFVRNGVVQVSNNSSATPMRFENNLFQGHTSTTLPLIRLPSQASSSVIAVLTGNDFVGTHGAPMLNVGFPAGSATIDADGNYWNGLSLSGANGVVRDFLDDASLAVAVIDPVLSSPNLAAPISMPVNVTVTWAGDVATLAWTAGPESDLDGFRVYYGVEDDLWALAGTDAAEGASGMAVAATTATLTGLDRSFPWKFAVTARDVEADGDDDLFEGHESWFARP